MEGGVRNGLKNMRSRVADLHGTFEVMSRAGTGTTIVIRVPMALPPEPSAKKAAPAAPVPGSVPTPLRVDTL